MPGRAAGPPSLAESQEQLSCNSGANSSPARPLTLCQAQPGAGRQEDPGAAEATERFQREDPWARPSRDISSSRSPGRVELAQLSCQVPSAGPAPRPKPYRALGVGASQGWGEGAWCRGCGGFTVAELHWKLRSGSAPDGDNPRGGRCRSPSSCPRPLCRLQLRASARVFAFHSSEAKPSRPASSGRGR